MDDNTRLRMALPKGSIERNVLRLMEEAGLGVAPNTRNYRPVANVDGLDIKFLKPQNIVEMLDVGRRDVGFAGADWTRELGADVVGMAVVVELEFLHGRSKLDGVDVFSLLQYSS